MLAMKLAELTEAFELVLVTWLDAASYGDGWYGSQDDLPDEPLEVETVGWLVKQTEKVVIVARTASEFKIEGILVIPSSLVVSIQTPPS